MGGEARPKGSARVLECHRPRTSGTLRRGRHTARKLPAGGRCLAAPTSRGLGACLPLGPRVLPPLSPLWASGHYLRAPLPPPLPPPPRAGLTPFPLSCPVLLPIPFLSSPPLCSCWEWRLHFSCHLHSQSIRTPQLSRLAELGGRRRRERVLWGLSPPHRSHSAPDCFLLRRAQPAGQGGEQEPLELALLPRNGL